MKPGWPVRQKGWWSYRPARLGIDSLGSLKGLQIRAKDDYMCDNKEHFHSKFTSWRPYLLLSTISEALTCTPRETGEGWTLMTVETKLK
jgi:hypothetical protein